MQNIQLFDDKTLKELGINKEGAEKEALIETLNSTIEERVGTAIYDLLDDDQAADFMQLIDEGDPSKIQQWLKANVPDYQDIIEDEYHILLGELSDNAALV